MVSQHIVVVEFSTLALQHVMLWHNLPINSFIHSFNSMSLAKLCSLYNPSEDHSIISMMSCIRCTHLQFICEILNPSPFWWPPLPPFWYIPFHNSLFQTFMAFCVPKITFSVVLSVLVANFHQFVIIVQLICLFFSRSIS